MKKKKLFFFLSFDLNGIWPTGVANGIEKQIKINFFL
jgi:hypothetical protein